MDEHLEPGRTGYVERQLALFLVGVYSRVKMKDTVTDALADRGVKDENIY
jgi:hypothetical protein